MPAPYPDQSSLGDYIGQSTPINITGPFPGLGYVTSTSSMNTVPNGTTGQHLVMGISGTPEWETETTTFDFVGDTGTTQTVDHGDTISFNGSNLIKTTSAATDVLDISLDVTGATTGQVVKFDGTNAIWSNDSITGGTPTEIVYIDNAGVGTSDALATRDSVTNETYIGYRTSGGDFSNGFHLGNILGGALSDGAAFQRHDAVNDNFTFIGTVDMTPFGGNTNALLGGYGDLVNGIFASTSYDDIGANVDYNNSVLGVSGAVTVNDSNTEISHQASSHTNSIRVQDSIDLKVDNTLGRNLLRLNGDYIRGNRSNSSAYFELNTANDTFNVGGRPSSLGFNTRLLHIDTLNATTAMGDVDGNLTNVKFATDLNAGLAYVDGLKTEVPNWTPALLSDGFTGTGLNDMHYDSTITYTGSYPRTYTSTVSATDCVYLLLTSIISPSFNFGDTVTDPVSGSTGTVVAGSDLDLYLIIQPIIDSGWNTATQVDDITTGGSANCSFQRYTDTFDWNDGTTFETYRDTNTFVPLNNGLTVGFYSPTGHTIGDTWKFRMIQGTVYSKMALFDGVNRTMSIGDVEQTVNDVRTDWVLGTGKNHGIYEYLGDAQEYHISNSVGNILVLDSDTFNQTVTFSIEDPFNGQTPFSVEAGVGAYGFRFEMIDAGQHSATLGAEGTGNNTFLKIDDDAKNIKFLADGLGTNSQDIPITAKVVLDASQLSTFGSVPIEVIPAPGAGRMIQPISAYGEYTHVTTAYANFGIPGLTHQPTSGSLPLRFSIGLMDQAYSYVQFAAVINTGYGAGFTAENQPLYFTDDDSSDPTTGDGTLTLYITYKIIKL